MNQKEFEKLWYSNDVSVVCHTSGSTGDPKEILLSKDLMKDSARRTVDFFSINAESRLHTCLDFDYIASKMMTARADVAGCKLTSEIPSNHPLASIERDEVIDLLSVVPSQLKSIIESGKKYSGMRRILVGGSPIPENVRHLVALSEYEVWESYGMTETASHIALRRVSVDSTTPFDTLSGITVCADGRGCLVIDMPGIGHLATNDVAEVLSPTQFRVLGRYDDCVISGGIKIMPSSLEETLGAFIAYDYCISSIPDTKWGEKLVLVLERHTDDFPEWFLEKAIGVRLNQYRKKLNLGVKSPKEIIFIDKIPMTQNGKIDRKALKSLLSGS